MIRSASRRAQDALREKEEAVFADASAKDLAGLADELYAVGGLLVAQSRLRRTVGDPATEPERRVAFISTLLDGKVSAPALDIVKAAANERWSSPWDLADAVESAGDDALFAAAEKDRTVDAVEDELFRFERILDSEGEVTSLLDEVAVEPERRLGLLDQLVDGKVSPTTLALLRHAVTSERKRSVLLAIDDLLAKSAERKQRSVARVISAVELTDAQVQRLSAALSGLYGREISVRAAIDPTVRGGLVIRIGDEVIDGSIATRLAHARSSLAG